MFNNYNQEQYYKNYPNMRMDLDPQYLNNFQKGYMIPNMYKQQQVAGIQGKTVDSLEVVKAMDIPLDRKCKLFPISRWNSYSY